MKKDDGTKVVRHSAKLEWVPLDKMRVRHGISQREFKPAWASEIANNFQLEKFMPPVVNKSGEWYWIIDGQHRTDALKQFLGEWHGQTVECLVYRNLSEKMEAEYFLDLNRIKTVSAMEKFIASLTAEREEETNIAAIVRLRGLTISQKTASEKPGSVSCVSTLARVYRRGADCLDGALEISHEAFGDPGLEARMIDGVGLLVSRYNGRLDRKRSIRALAAYRGGANAVISRSETLRKQTGLQRTQCIAAACVEIINRSSRGAAKLPSWFRGEA